MKKYLALGLGLLFLVVSVFSQIHTIEEKVSGMKKYLRPHPYKPDHFCSSQLIAVKTNIIGA